jgi:hypothetical protein
MPVKCRNAGFLVEFVDCLSARVVGAGQHLGEGVFDGGEQVGEDGCEWPRSRRCGYAHIEEGSLVLLEKLTFPAWPRNDDW